MQIVKVKIFFGNKKTPVWRINSKFLKYFLNLHFIRGVAQLASVLAWGARGRKFESSRPDNKKNRL